MQYSEASTWIEIGRQLQTVKEKCNSTLAALSLPETDARSQGMIHVRQCCNTLAAVPLKLQQFAKDDDNRPTLARILGLQSETALEDLLTDLNMNSKGGFLTVVQFALEHSARQVVSALTKSAPYKFFEIAKKLVVACGIDDADRKVELLLLPAYIRNALHSNGIHTKSTKTIVVGGEPYTFTENQRLECGSWSHLFVAVYHSLCVYEEAYLSSRVKILSTIPAA